MGGAARGGGGGREVVELAQEGEERAEEGAVPNVRRVIVAVEQLERGGALGERRRAQPTREEGGIERESRQRVASVEGEEEAPAATAAAACAASAAAEAPSPAAAGARKEGGSERRAARVEKRACWSSVGSAV